MDTGILCNKEMVDLLMRVKRHTKANHNITLNMSDRDLMVKLVDMAAIKDDLLQGMLQYFMVLAGGDWSARYGRAANSKAKENSVMEFAQKVKDSLLKDSGTLSSAVMAQPTPASAKVRYYRGQPIIRLTRQRCN
ncbi:MAG: hypothetical protein M0Q95_15055 [Porticoccaceae bacterium]|nr:hypothetical protein [Porticoccaceae bacterium]